MIKHRVEPDSHIREVFACCISGLIPDFLQLDPSPRIVGEHKQQPEAQPTHH